MIGALRIFRARWGSFTRLSVSQKVLVLEAALWLFVSMPLVKLVPFRYWSRYLGTKEAENQPVDTGNAPATAREVAQAIRRVNRVFRDRFTCLMQAVAGKAMLNRRSISNTLVLGARTLPDPNRGLKMEAHAWLRCGATIVLGGEVHDRFAVVAQFHSPTLPHNAPDGHNSP